jgi:hypothetical protein
MVLHLAHEVALATGAIEQVPDSTEPGGHVASVVRRP